jgi:ubiquinone/menaquinone biosynthesis C-methylase UbiE
MIYEKQVDRSHYAFAKYYSKERWSSIWHQVDEVLKFEPKSVLEVGGGLGVFKHAMSCFDVLVTSADIAQDLKPDIVGSITELPIEDNSFDVTCAFQVLEHLPFDHFSQGLKELKRVARKAIIISLPDAKPVYPVSICLPRLGNKQFLVPKLFVDYKKMPLHWEHVWEVNRPNYEIGRILRVFSELRISNVSTYRVSANPYHRFFIARFSND